FLFFDLFQKIIYAFVFFVNLSDFLFTQLSLVFPDHFSPVVQLFCHLSLEASHRFRDDPLVDEKLHGRFHPFVFPVAQASDLSGLNAASQKFPYIFIFLLPFPEETPGVVEIPAIDLTGATEVCPDVKSVPHFLGGSDMVNSPPPALATCSRAFRLFWSRSNPMMLTTALILE